MPRYYVDSKDLIAVADAIREKAKLDDILIFPDDFISAIKKISTSVVILQDSDGYLYFHDKETFEASDPIVGYGQVGHMIIHSVVDPTSPVVDEGQADYMIVAADRTSSTVDEGQADYMIVADDDASSYIV